MSMKLAVANGKFASPQISGGIKSLLTLLNNSNHQFDVDAFQLPPVKDVDLDFRYQIHSKNIRRFSILTWVDLEIMYQQWCRIMKKEFAQTQYDVAIAQNHLAPATMKAAAESDIPKIFFVRSIPLLGYGRFDPNRSILQDFRNADFGGKIQYLFLWKNYKNNLQALRDSEIVVTNSKFVQSVVDKLYNVESTVIYPPIDLEEYKVEYDPDGQIMMANPGGQKGGGIFLDVAEELPDEDFLLVGTSRASKTIQKRARSLDNVTTIEWCEDMREAYTQSKVVVVPSQYEEPFGRVAAEAIASGIPTVVSNKGGLPEVVGDCGFVVENIESVSAWCDAVFEAMTSGFDSKRVRRVEKLFSVDVLAEQFDEVLEEVK